MVNLCSVGTAETNSLRILGFASPVEKVLNRSVVVDMCGIAKKEIT